ncbi:hypothetical protein BC936DRAFT_144208 [Jimgerdemannia flammicorona]|uniref:Uncharacterized protein n=1 Tax=Jimgerdemannia flammicorona TaxID=994334 RepID=A0A433DCU6_9FUNG|nr:hypothetical protein BC936DRAFT_144208 [Jimgerdemannia flammicorona]
MFVSLPLFRRKLSHVATSVDLVNKTQKSSTERLPSRNVLGVVSIHIHFGLSEHRMQTINVCETDPTRAGVDCCR